MMRAILIPLAGLAFATASVTPATSRAQAAAQTPASVAIRHAMEASAAGWNAGDLARFVAIYADDALFVTPKGCCAESPRYPRGTRRASVRVLTIVGG